MRVLAISVSTRVEHVKAQGRTEDLQAAAKGSAAPPQASAGLEDSIWLCPIEDRSRLRSRTHRTAAQASQPSCRSLSVGPDGAAARSFRAPRLAD